VTISACRDTKQGEEEIAAIDLHICISKVLRIASLPSQLKAISLDSQVRNLPAQPDAKVYK
jgi:hypothetical protein